MIDDSYGEVKMINHVGIIADGTRRWAKINSLDLYKAYLLSMNHLEEIILHIFQLDIPLISVYLLSTENLKRQKNELEAVLKAETDFCLNIAKKSSKMGFNVNHIGIKEYLPSYLSNVLKFITEERTTVYKQQLNLLIGYNPFDEINYAISHNNGRISLTSLWVKEKVDLVIRTGGGNVALSNFLPLQTGYAQILISNELFNDFSIPELDSLIEKSNFITQKNGE